ncbi:hypothetical protein ADEAN_000423200 [Angomonas deanei]|uniref:Uncharacterized protein n=1 Tax=Angomonas deanei TaxID=59799 RepID=A0A7G2CB65_9TRYP|nr:hypothetical protein ADEAN_000423200 [Angomonas deanei]
MELGKLTDQEAGNIFYFTVDETNPQSPRRERTKTFYVVSLSSSYIDSFYFLCHSLCSEKRLPQWHLMYERLFGEISYTVFRTNVQSAPRWNFASGSIESLPDCAHSICGLYRDETSARLGLQAIINYDTSIMQRQKKQLRERRQSSFTPPKASEESKLIHPVAMNRQLDYADSTTNSMRDSALVNLSSIKASSLPVASMEMNPGWKNLYDQTQANKENELEGVKQELRELRQKYDQERKVNRELTSRASDSPGTAEFNPLNNGMITSARYTSSNNSLPFAPKRNTVANGDQEADKANQLLTNSRQDVINTLTEQLRLKEALLSSLMLDRKNEVSQFQNKIKDLERKLVEERKGNGEKLCDLVMENKNTIAKLEENMERKEAELRKVYEVALQSSDVRLAQMTEKLSEAQRKKKELADSVVELEKIKEEVKEWEKCHEAARRKFDTVCESEKTLRAELDAANQLLSQQRTELQQASQLIEKLKAGLETVRYEIPNLWREVHQHNNGFPLQV